MNKGDYQSMGKKEIDRLPNSVLGMIFTEFGFFKVVFNILSSVMFVFSIFGLTFSSLIPEVPNNFQELLKEIEELDTKVKEEEQEGLRKETFREEYSYVKDLDENDYSIPKYDNLTSLDSTPREQYLLVDGEELTLDVVDINYDGVEELFNEDVYLKPLRFYTTSIADDENVTRHVYSFDFVTSVNQANNNDFTYSLGEYPMVVNIKTDDYLSGGLKGEVRTNFIVGDNGSSQRFRSNYEIVPSSVANKLHGQDCSEFLKYDFGFAFDKEIVSSEVVNEVETTVSYQIYHYANAQVGYGYARCVTFDTFTLVLRGETLNEPGAENFYISQDGLARSVEDIKPQIDYIEYYRVQ